MALAELLDKNVKKENQWFSLSLQALKNVHLGSADISNSYTSRLGDPRQVNLLGYLALIVLLIACINYMNMSTARSQKRFREVGINKTIGASKMQLVKRFYLETAVLVIFALFLALAFIQFSFPLFNQLADTSFGFRDLIIAFISWWTCSYSYRYHIDLWIIPCILLKFFFSQRFV